MEQVAGKHVSTTTTNQLIYLRDTIMVKLKGHPSAKPFLNNDGSPTAAATKVMDLHTIDTKLNLGQYPDLDLIFDNCYRSFKSGSEQWREAKKLESFYIHSLKQMPLQEVEVEDAKGNKGEGKT